MTRTQNTILIIEDDNDINQMLSRLLQLNGFSSVSAYSGTEGLLLHNETISLILLDLMLPGKNGEEIIDELKKKNPVPIIVMSAIHNVDKKVDLFTLGADDYVNKPFHNEELLARIRLQLKHAQAARMDHDSSGSVSDNTLSEKQILHYKDITLNPDTHEVFCNNKELHFTKYEFELLSTLMKNPKRVFSKSNLFELIWGEEFFVEDNTINVHISNIRNKLRKCNPTEEYIETVWSVGYKMKP